LLRQSSDASKSYFFFEAGFAADFFAAFLVAFFIEVILPYRLKVCGTKPQRVIHI
jgi:hypothetical protein